jgi:hypothetical protein
MGLFTDISADENITLTSLYALSPPNPLAVEARTAKVKSLIKKMGNKYLLAKKHVVKRDDTNND